MNLYIIRHAEAFDRDAASWPDDRIRPLTPRGKRRWRRAARGLGRIAKDVSVVLSSPLTRTWETAETLEEEAEWPTPIRCETLEPGVSPHALLETLRFYSADSVIALVGHEPDLHRFASYLLSGDAGAIDIELEKGACVSLTLTDDPAVNRAELHWLLTPKALRALRR